MSSRILMELDLKNRIQFRSLRQCPGRLRTTSESQSTLEEDDVVSEVGNLHVTTVAPSRGRKRRHVTSMPTRRTKGRAARKQRGQPMPNRGCARMAPVKSDELQFGAEGEGFGRTCG
jgi:hypothetical protein